MDRFLIKKSAARPQETEEISCESDDEISETKNNPKRKFRAAWLDEFSWLQNIHGCAFCIACEKKICNHVSYLRKHASIRSHIHNVELKKNQIKINSLICSEKESFVKQVHNAELTLVMFLIYHNLPFLLMDFLPGLLLECCPDSKIAKGIKCGRTKATQLAESLGNKAKLEIVSKLKTTKFSLIVDETTDISTKKSLVLVARYMDKLSQRVCDKFLSLIEVVASDAKSLYDAIKDFLKHHDIPLDNIIGLATDGANVMAGEISGMQARFKNDIDIFYIKCTCHSLHLCSAYACKKLPIQIEILCRSIYNFFAHSPKRINELKEFQDYCNVEPHKILGISLTRWLSLENVINRLVEQWSALQLYFISTYLEVNGIKACELGELMGDPSLKVYFLFLSYILNIINNLNKEFQSEKVRLPYVYSQIETNFKLILSNFTKTDYIKSLNSLESLNLHDECYYLNVENIFIGRKAELYMQEINMSDLKKYEIKKNIQSFYIQLLTEIAKRFDFSRKDLKNLDIITPNTVLISSELCLESLLESFPNLTGGNEEQILTQWKLLRFSNLDIKGDIDIVEFWDKVSKYKNGIDENSFEQLSYFVHNLLSLPHSSAAAERMFSQLNLIKTKFRNCLDVKTINSIMQSKELCKNPNVAHYVWSAKDGS